MKHVSLGVNHRLRSMADDERVRRFLPIGVIFAAVSLVGSVVILRGTEFAVYDEGSHLSLAWSISHGRIPTRGDLMEEEVLRLWQCRGQSNLHIDSRCDNQISYDEFPFGALQYNVNHPPLFYLTVGLLARVIALVPGVDFLVAARFGSLLWAFCGLIALYAVLRLLNVPRIVSTTTVLLTFLSPWVLRAATSVNPDSASILAGAGAAWIVIMAMSRHRTRLSTVSAVWASVGISLLVTSTKVVNSVVLVVASITVIAISVLSKRMSGRRSRPLAIAIASLVTVVTSYLLWVSFQLSRPVDTYYINPMLGLGSERVSGLPLDEWASTLFAGFDYSGAGFFLGPASTEWTLGIWASACSILISGFGLLGYFLIKDEDGRRLAIVGVVGMLLWPLIVQIDTFMSGFYFPNPSPRYGLGIIPIVWIVIAMFVTERRLWKWQSVLLIAGSVITICSILGVAINGI